MTVYTSDAPLGDLTALINAATLALNPSQVADGHITYGGVAAALLCASGNIYTGVCIDTSSSMGMCAEVCAAANMLTAGETKVTAMVAVHYSGRILPPCGKCREFISQLRCDPTVIVALDTTRLLSELLPFDWKLPPEQG